MNEDVKNRMNVSISKRSIYSVLGLVLLVGFTYIQFQEYIIPGLIEFFEQKIKNATIAQIGLMWVPIIAYFLIAGNVCLAVNIVKPLKFWHKNGLIEGLIIGFIVALMGGLIVALFLAFFMGLMGGILVGLMVSLSGSLILVIVPSLIDEFK